MFKNLEQEKTRFYLKNNLSYIYAKIFFTCDKKYLNISVNKIEHVCHDTPL